MSVVMQINPYEFFVDGDGDALDLGYIWIGQPNQYPKNYPVVAYYDEALTIPAAAPLRTSNGYIMRNGSPTFLYINGNYSILVEDKNGRQIFYVPDFLMTGNGGAVSLSDLANQTNPAKGLGLVGYRNRTAWVALSYLGVSPMDFGAPGAGLTDTLDAVNMAVAEAKARRIPLNIDAFFAVSGPVVIEDANGFRMKGLGIIRTTSTTAQYVLDVKNCTDFVAEGVTIDGDSKTNLVAIGRMAAIGVGKTCSLNRSTLSMINGPVMWQHGDFSAPDNLCSENKIGGFSYNTPVGIINIGSQAVVNVNDADIVCAGLGVFAAYSHSLVISYGGSVKFCGSEAQMPTVSNGFAFVSCPIDSPLYDNSYARISLQSTAIETPSLLFLAYNPNAVPTPAADTGGLIMNGCDGYHNCAVESFQGISSFSGSVLVGDNQIFRLTTKLTQNAAFSGPAKVEISDTWSDDHFIKGLAGINGGIALFDHRQIFTANNLNGQTIAVGTTVLIYQSVPGTGDNAHFYSNYNIATGVFTVPTGGLRSVQVSVGFVNSQPNVGSELQVRVDGAIIQSSSGVGTRCTGSFELGDLNAGQTIVVQFLNLAASFAAAGVSLDRITISARR